PAVSEALSRAVAILAELRCWLDASAGAELAERLDALYEYAIGRLVAANATREAAPLAEARAVIAELEAGFRQAFAAPPPEEA
ncbi:MAG TPA: flagellar protein FliS, partial [Planctomycetota bacterium]|nr:flagellar protein FliS [Planctomycetota bacterium]